MRNKLLVLLTLIIAFSLSACGGKSQPEIETTKKRYGDYSHFILAETPKTITLNKLVQITIPAGWRYDPAVESLTIFDLKPIMIAYKNFDSKELPVFLEFFQSKQSAGAFPGQEKLKNMSQGDIKNLTDVVMNAPTPGVNKISMHVIPSQHDVMMIKVATSIPAKFGHPEKKLISAKIPTEEVANSLLFAYYDYQENPALQNEINELFNSVGLAGKK